jgi:hypothetical protein
MSMNQQSGFFASIVLSLIALIMLPGCGDIIQDLQINPDGSGKLETTFDVGELMSMTKNLGGVGGDDTTFSDDTIPDTISTKVDTLKDPMQLIIDRVTDPAYGKDFDTIMSLVSIMPDSVKAKEPNLDLAKQLSIRLVSPANSAGLTIGLIANFNSPQHLKDIMHYMENMDEKPEVMASAGPVGLQSKSFLIFDADMKAGLLTFDSIKYGDMVSELGMSQDSTMSSEDMGMVQMMFGNSKIKSMIHVPGEVISCSNPDAILTKDNRVLLEYEFMDVIQKGSIPGFTIQFKPHK